jgi:dipeptidyl-peptidase-4
LWSSERDGFRHLYLYSLDGKQLNRLTSGRWEVTSVDCVDEAAERVYYTSTEPTPLERQLYSVKLDGSDKRRLTSESGTNSASVGPGCGYSVRTFSSVTEPSSRTIYSSAGAEIGVWRKPDRRVLDEYEILPTEFLQVRASDGTLLNGRLIRPAGFRPGRKYPAVVMVYGGPGAQSVRNSWRGADYDQVLAHHGFVIWQLDNRGSSGYGHAFETPVRHRFGEQELADQKDGVKHLISMGFVDPARIGIHGWSYGGYMTLTAMFHAPEIFHAGVAGAPVTDFREYDTIYTERYMGLPSENEEGYRKAAPLHFASQLQGKLMLAHNFEDDNVLFQHTLRMMDALQKAGKHFDLLLYPQKAHGVTGPARRHFLEAMTDFFERNLK